MIEKMRFLSITGSKEDIDRVADVYIDKYQMHLENALAKLGSSQTLTPYMDTNPYKESLALAAQMALQLPEDAQADGGFDNIEEANAFINQTYESLKLKYEKLDELKARKAAINEDIHKVLPFRLFNFNIKPLMNARFIKFRYGKISHEHFNRFLKYEYEQLNVIFIESSSDDNYVFGMYFVPSEYADKVDAIFSSMHFERILVPSELSGTPEQVFQSYTAKFKEVSGQIKSLKSEIKKEINSTAGRLLCAKEMLEKYEAGWNIRKLAACTRDRYLHSEYVHNVFYILCGWMTEDNANAFLKEIEDDPKIFVISEDGREGADIKPPTRLKNPGLFRPFEMFVSLYGLPSYKELDPTIFVALTYSFLFGMMFGDLGQGLCLTIGGFLFYRFKKQSLGGILSLAGIFSSIFGVMYGSVFGFEEVFTAVWTNPMHDVMTVLYTAIGFGISLNLLSMILNIANGIRMKDKGRIFFSTNGVAGLVFYALAIACGLLYLTGRNLPATILLIVGFGIPLLCLFLQEPLSRLLEHKKKLIEGTKGMFFVQSFFEMFDILLSFITNTLSFVRVGAFALSHAGMMSVVLMLGKASTQNPSIVTLILGNIFVMGLEGLCAGIQVLRLEYYELFSRFYSGTGKPFRPFKLSKNIQ